MLKTLNKTPPEDADTRGDENQWSGSVLTMEQPLGTIVPASDVDLLKRIAIFHELDMESLVSLAVSLERRSYLRGQLIMQPGLNQPPTAVLTCGSARVYRISALGNEVTLDSLSAGDVYGLSLLDAGAGAKDFLEATTDGTEVFHIPARCLREMMLSRPRLALAVFDTVCQRLVDARDRIEDLALHDLKSRLAHTLARCAIKDEQYEVLATRRELAWVVGAREEEVTKALRHLRECDVIAYEPRSSRIVVRDPPSLLHYGEE